MYDCETIHHIRPRFGQIDHFVNIPTASTKTSLPCLNRVDTGGAAAASVPSIGYGNLAQDGDRHDRCLARLRATEPVRRGTMSGRGLFDYGTLQSWSAMVRFIDKDDHGEGRGDLPADISLAIRRM